MPLNNDGGRFSVTKNHQKSDVKNQWEISSGSDERPFREIGPVEQWPEKPETQRVTGLCALPRTENT